MIPVKLILSNFTSYGGNPPKLDFTKFKLAAISGLNGAGKSSLLDALTWCVWGTSRAGESSDNLIHSGADEMLVEFSFELDSHNFTVKRSRSKRRGGLTALELWSGSHNLTEGTIKATQEKIIQNLHLTFETFTNSSYLRQGHADEFTTKGPTDRKRILSEILGLNHYERLEEKAKEKSKQSQVKLQLLDYQLLEIEAELLQKEGREKSLSLAEEEAKRVEAQLVEVEKLIKIIQQEHQVVLSTLKSFEEKKLLIKTVRKELEDINLQITVKQKAKEEFQGIFEQKKVVEENYQKLLTLQGKKKELEAKRSQIIKLKDQWAALQKVIVALEQRRTNKITTLEVEIKKLETENEQLQIQIDHLYKHKDSCPTCGQEIGTNKNKQIVTENKKKIGESTSQIDSLKVNLEKCKTFPLKEKGQAGDLENQIKSLESETKEWDQLNEDTLTLDKYSNLYIKLQKAEIGVKTHTEAILDLQKIYSLKEEQLKTSQEELEELEGFEGKLQNLTEKLMTEETTKMSLSKKALELRGQVGEAKQLVSRNSQLEDLASQKKQDKNKLQKERDIFEELSLAFGKKGIQAMIIETAIPEIEEETNQLLGRLTEGRMRIALQTQRETKTKLSDGEKGIVETLDIIISDEMGERPYENFSGGEKFRVDFAIRLAISKLLTNRAGARLQFLVIDEGFGSQDAPGIAKLVEAIDAIKDDFEKILIITHIDELKMEFPVRIEVSKNSEGSTFEVVGV